MRILQRAKTFYVCMFLRGEVVSQKRGHGFALSATTVYDPFEAKNYDRTEESKPARLKEWSPGESLRGPGRPPQSVQKESPGDSAS